MSISALVFLSSLLFAQVADSSKKYLTKNPPVQYCQEKDFSLNSPPLYTSIDTSLDGVQKYFPNNFPYSLGLANRKTIFESSPEIGFRSGFDFLNLFGYSKEEIKYYHTRTPYTEINVVFGMKKEQFSRLIHTQNITKQWNIALTMLRLNMVGPQNSPGGFYQHQTCSDNNISLSTNYASKNNRYSLLANGIINSIKAEENGGVTTDLYFEENPFVDKKQLPVNLLDAKTKRGNREFYVKQSVFFGSKENQMKGDSVISYRLHPKHSFSYSINVKDNWFVYSENSPNSGYYENIYLDSVKTLDSTHIFTLQNSISWKSTLFKNTTAEISFDQKTSHIVQHEIDSFPGPNKGNNMGTNTYIKDNTVHLDIGKKPVDIHTNGFYWNLNGNYILSGTNQGNYLMNGDLFAIIKNSKKILFELVSDSRSAPFIYSNYTSNHFRWKKDSLNNISETRMKLNYFDSKNHFSIGAEMNRITGYVYFDSTFSPKQFNGTLTIYSAFIQKNFRLKWFHFNNKITWQSTGTPAAQPSAEVIRLPQFVTNHSLYYEDKWFSKVMDIQVGIDVSFYTLYYADAYMPALGLYYLQNGKEIGNYPFVDFFFNMKVKHANIFFKSEHVNSGLMGAIYYLAPHIPAPDRSIKVGIRWMFYD